jgi:large subunit ribosomal protein L25
MDYRLKAYPREQEKPEALRQAGKLPGVLYGKDVNRKIYVELREFDRIFRQASIHHVITLELEGKEQDTLIRQVNLDKRRRRPEHVDFLALSDEPILMYIPLKFVGTPRGVREGGVLDAIHRDIQVRVSPRAIPEYIEVDVSDLGIGDALHTSDLKLPPGVSLAIDAKEALVAVVPPEDVERLSSEVAPAAEPEVIKKGKTEESS